MADHFKRVTGLRLDVEGSASAAGLDSLTLASGETTDRYGSFIVFVTKNARSQRSVLSQNPSALHKVYKNVIVQSASAEENATFSRVTRIFDSLGKPPGEVKLWTRRASRRESIPPAVGSSRECVSSISVRSRWSTATRPE